MSDQGGQAPEQEAQQPSINLETATQFIQKAGGRVFLDSKELENKISQTLERVDAEKIQDPTDFESSVIKFLNKRNAIFYGKIDNKLQQAGIPKEENELTEDHLVRVINSLKDGKIKGVDPGEVEALKSKLQEAVSGTSKAQQELEDLKTKILTQERDNLITKGVPENLEYNAKELSVLLPGLKDQFLNAFQIEKDGEKWKAIDKSKNIPVLTPDGDYMSPDEVFKGFIDGIESLRRTPQQQNGAGIPIGMTEGERKDKESDWRNVLDKKGLIGTEKKAQIIRKEMGLPISDRAKSIWPELK